MTATRRFRAPTAAGAVLADPPAAAVPALVSANAKTLAAARCVIDGVSLADFRRAARLELAPDAWPDVPWILSGHQPELSHPGVWAKNFALAAVAKAVGGVGLNLVVDNDTLKTPGLRVPRWHPDDPRRTRLETVPFDHTAGEEPYETRRVTDRGLFDSFPDRVADVSRNWPWTPLLPRAWELVRGDPAPTIGEKFTAVRRHFECEWGCRNRELAVSRLAESRAFRRFAGHIFADLPRFRAAYNGAVRAYRARHGIRSTSHPVPDLADGEPPFWGPADAAGRRGRATSAGNPIRPRALTLTLFARVCVGDFFLHGIGGGKYDEVTDAIIRDYFGIAPPAYQVLSATVLLPFPPFPGTPTDAAALARLERDVYWNPQRYVPGAAAAHAELAGREPPTADGRKARYRAFRDLAETLRPRAEPVAADARDRHAAAAADAAANAVLGRRDFAWVLFPEDTLRPAMRAFL